MRSECSGIISKLGIRWAWFRGIQGSPGCWGCYSGFIRPVPAGLERQAFFGDFLANIFCALLQVIVVVVRCVFRNIVKIRLFLPSRR